MLHLRCNDNDYDAYCLCTKVTSQSCSAHVGCTEKRAVKCLRFLLFKLLTLLLSVCVQTEVKLVYKVNHVNKSQGYLTYRSREKINC